MKEIRLIIKTKNNILLKQREALGLSQNGMAIYIGVNNGCYGDIENLKKKPKNNNGEWCKVALDISKKLKMLPEDLFPDSLSKIKNPIVQKEISVKDIESYLSYNEQIALPVDTIYREKEKKYIINNVLNTLTHKEAAVLEYRFGLNGEDEHTLRDVGKIYGVEQERIRQIEAKALQKLRMRKRRKILEEYYD